jgi:hypothetical protein
MDRDWAEEAQLRLTEGCCGTMGFDFEAGARTGGSPLHHLL